MLYEIFLWQPLIICSPFAQPRDGPLQLRRNRRKATSYKTGFGGIHDSSASLAQALTSPANAQVTSCRQPVARSLNIHRAAWASSTWDGSSSYDLDSKTWLSWKLPPIPRSHAQERSLEAMPMITTFLSLSRIPPKPVL